MERRQSLNFERFFVVQKVWELVKLCAERRLASSLVAFGTAIAPGAASFRGAFILLFPPPGQWARPATSHELALTGTIEGRILAKKAAKLAPLAAEIAWPAGGRKTRLPPPKPFTGVRGHQARPRTAGLVRNSERAAWSDPRPGVTRARPPCACHRLDWLVSPASNGQLRL